MNRSEIKKWLTKCSPMDGSDFAEACDGAVDEIESYEKLLERTRWIPVSDRLPEKDKSVFVFTDCGETDFAYIGHTTGRFTNGMLLIPNVTHWMPLPEPPEQDV